MFIALLSALLFSTIPTADTPQRQTNKPIPVINKTLLLQLVNAARKEGCQCGDTWYPSAPPVSWNATLEQAAFNHSRDMNTKQYFSHTAPDGTGAGTRLDAAGYKWRGYGENIAMGYSSEKEVVKGWLKSPGHCKNMMNKRYKEMGVARDGLYWTQEFGTR